MLTPDEIDALPTYTAAQHVKVWEWALVKVAVKGTSLEINGRSYTSEDSNEIRENIVFWREQAACESADYAGGNVLARLNQPS